MDQPSLAAHQTKQYSLIPRIWVFQHNIVSASSPDECADKAAQDLSPEFLMVFCANLRILAQWSRSPTRKGVLAKPKPSGSGPS
jgi:hypothetical protein